MSANLNEIIANLGVVPGVVSRADGSLGAVRGGKTGEMLVSQAHSKYYEAASRGKLFYSHVPTAAMSAPATAAIGNIIWNPPTSGVLCVLTKWSLIYKVTDADAMAIDLCYSVQATLPTTVTAATTGPCYLGAVGVSNSACKAYAIGTITTAATPIFGMCKLEAAINTVGAQKLSGDFEGIFIAPPGYLFSLHSIVAAAASGIGSTLIWEEVPII